MWLVAQVSDIVLETFPWLANAQGESQAQLLGAGRSSSKALGSFPSDPGLALDRFDYLARVQVSRPATSECNNASAAGPPLGTLQALFLGGVRRNRARFGYRARAPMG